MQSKNRKLAVAILAALALVGGYPAAAQATEADGITAAPACADIANLALADEGIEPTGPIQFTCIGPTVTVRAFVNTPDEVRVERQLDLGGDSSPLRSSERAGGEASGEEALDVPLEMSQRLANDDWNCSPGDYGSEIRSELEFFMYACVYYGFYDPDDSSNNWSKTIDFQWTMYTGFPSAQNKIRTIPSAGSPTMSGTVTSRKQNGWWAPPTELSSSLWENVGNTTTNGWVVGLMNTTGSHSLRIADMHLEDVPKGYDEAWSEDGGFDSFRFWCSEDEERCYFPNGEEAGV